MGTEVIVQDQPGKGCGCCHACAPQACGNQVEKESRTHKPSPFKAAAVVCCSVSPCRSQLAPHSSWEAEFGEGSLLHQRFVFEARLSPDAVMLRMTVPGTAPLGSVPQVFPLCSTTSPLDLCFSFSLDGIKSFMCPRAPTRAILQRNEYSLLPSLYSY